MPQCEHYEVCDLDALEDTDEELCILHSQNPTKDKHAFKEALEAHRKRKGENFRFFVFPVIADFSHAKWTKSEKGALVLTGATFTQKADFRAVTFTKGADFQAAIFTQKADFSSATFAEEAVFYKATFTEEADFNSATFTKAAYFISVTFTKGADFNRTTFTQKTYFRDSTFKGKTVFAPGAPLPQIFSETEVDFSMITLEPPDVLIFQDADLRKITFRGTDLRKAEMTNVDWPEIVWPKKMPKGFGWLRSKRFGVYDEDSLQKGRTHSFPHIERLYRELKQNYEDRRDYDRAGDFHYGEKEMRRKSPKTLARHWFPVWIYWWASGYGERCLRPLFWFVGLLLLSTFGYLYWGLEPKGSSSRMVMTNGWDCLKSVHYSLRVMILLKPDDLVPVGFGKFMNTVQSVFGPVLIGLFALALRQRLKR